MFLYMFFRSVAGRRPDVLAVRGLEDVRGQEAQVPSWQDHQQVRGANQHRHRKAHSRADQAGRGHIQFIDYYA